MPTTFDGTQALRDAAGSELGVSSWYELTQERIDAFAEVTQDLYGLHTDPAWAAEHSPLKTTIAHGLFTLSLGPKCMYEIATITAGLSLNYGYDKVRFTAPVPSGSKVRMRAVLTAVDDVQGGVRARITQTFEIEGQDKPACVAEWLSMYYD